MKKGVSAKSTIKGTFTTFCPLEGHTGVQFVKSIVHCNDSQTDFTSFEVESKVDAS